MVLMTSMEEMTTQVGEVSMSKLQDLARERNWYRWMVVKTIHLDSMRHIKISSATQARVNRLNYEIERLREDLDDDWRAQRRAVRQQEEKSS